MKKALTLFVMLLSLNALALDVTTSVGKAPNPKSYDNFNDYQKDYKAWAVKAKKAQLEIIDKYNIEKLAENEQKKREFEQALSTYIINSKTKGN